MSLALMWFRRDLRLEDNTALHHALNSGSEILPIFIFDENILSRLEDEDDARVHFIYDTIQNLKTQLITLGSDLKVFYGDPFDIIKSLIHDHEIKAVYFNRDYETYALDRDEKVVEYFKDKGIHSFSYKDHVIFEGSEVRKDDGDPYVVFTPFSRKWIQNLGIPDKGGISPHLESRKCNPYYQNFIQTRPSPLMPLNKIGFRKSDIDFPSVEVSQDVIRSYNINRDFPYMRGTSRLGVHFRFGTISIREKARKAIQLNKTYLNELIWRDFYSMILQEFPRVEKESFRKKYENLEWRNNEHEFEMWCEGKTGYPLVDAGMRELNTTGFMHNRVRMVVASFLTKHLLIDWRWGEAYFARKLLDFDLASNNGGWQWAAGCGTDAAPYFRIFNPESQRKKFDPDNKYIKTFVPEFGSNDYPEPIVDHKFARQRCLETYKIALNR